MFACFSRCRNEKARQKKDTILASSLAPRTASRYSCCCFRARFILHRATRLRLCFGPFHSTSRGTHFATDTMADAGRSVLSLARYESTYGRFYSRSSTRWLLWILAFRLVLTTLHWLGILNRADLFLCLSWCSLDACWRFFFSLHWVVAEDSLIMDAVTSLFTPRLGASLRIAMNECFRYLVRLTGGMILMRCSV